MAEPETDQPTLTKEHCCAFGAITVAFARHEMLMVGAISNLLNVNPGGLMHLTAEMPYRAKKDALTALIKQSDLSKSDQNRIVWHLGQFHTYNDLRNSIAHYIWKRGTRPGSVKPLSLSVRSGKTTIRGITHDEDDYTVEELNSIADKLFDQQRRFTELLESFDLWPLKIPTEGDK